jgi:hypothetical protein
MNHRHLLACLGLAATWLAPVRAEERNAWPAAVKQLNDNGQVISTNAIGPLLFSKQLPEGGRASGFRPFYIQRTNASDRIVESASLYPLFAYRADDEGYSWTVFSLINRSGLQPGASPKLRASNDEKLAIWPFYFSKQTGDPATSYRGLLPVVGTIKSFFGYDRISWVLFPLYVEVDKKDAHTVLAPWPFLRFTSGAEQGFAFWPLFGWRDRPGEFKRRYALWPLIWNHTLYPHDDALAGTPPMRQVGFIPFYTREKNADSVNVNFVWPFFGYTDKTAPFHYRETRYLWPFLVQGRGDDRLVNRWGPFYTHSVIKGYDKTWIGWPLWRQAKWEADNLAQKKSQLLFFFYWSVEQRSLSNPHAAPAHKTHVWPLVSSWDDGAGRRQYQIPSPFEVFFPNNDLVRQTWTPLFALYRYDQRAPGNVRTSLLWDGITWERNDAEQRAEFHLGPIFSVQRKPGERRIAFGNGLFGAKRLAGEHAWRLFWLDFSSKPAKVPSAESATR